MFRNEFYFLASMGFPVAKLIFDQVKDLTVLNFGQLVEYSEGNSSSIYGRIYSHTMESHGLINKPTTNLSILGNLDINLFTHNKTIDDITINGVRLVDCIYKKINNSIVCILVARDISTSDYIPLNPQYDQIIHSWEWQIYGTHNEFMVPCFHIPNDMELNRTLVIKCPLSPTDLNELYISSSVIIHLRATNLGQPVWTLSDAIVPLNDSIFEPIGPITVCSSLSDKYWSTAPDDSGVNCEHVHQNHILEKQLVVLCSWVWYTLSSGVDRIILYLDFINIKFERMIKKALNEEIMQTKVVLFHSHVTNHPPHLFQAAFLNHCLYLLKWSSQSTWMGTFDIDEYIFLGDNYPNLRDFLYRESSITQQSAAINILTETWANFPTEWNIDMRKNNLRGKVISHARQKNFVLVDRAVYMSIHHISFPIPNQGVTEIVMNPTKLKLIHFKCFGALNKKLLEKLLYLPSSYVDNSFAIRFKKTVDMSKFLDLLSQILFF